MFHGCDLYTAIGKPLLDELEGKSLGRLQVLVDARSNFFPLELVYGLPVPTSDATLCRGWKTALGTGICPEPHDETGRRRLAKTVCPSGFWALRR